MAKSLKQDRKLVAAKQKHEVAYVAKKSGLPASVAKAIIKEYGPSRRNVYRILRELKNIV